MALPTTLPHDFGRFLDQALGIIPMESSFLKSEPWPHTVEYAGGRHSYVPPDRFYWGERRGPSDCSWIVPGTGEQNS